MADYYLLEFSYHPCAEQNMELYAVFIDFRKAFDTVQCTEKVSFNWESQQTDQSSSFRHASQGSAR